MTINSQIAIPKMQGRIAIPPTPSSQLAASPSVQDRIGVTDVYSHDEISSSRIQLAVKRSLKGSLESKAVLDDKGYVELPEQNLIPGVQMEYFEPDLREGDGDELKSKFLAAHSSTALAVNCFAWFRANGRLQHLSILNKGGARDLRFERKF